MSNKDYYYYYKIYIAPNSCCFTTCSKALYIKTVIKTGSSKNINNFDIETARWRLNTALCDGKKFVFGKNGWKILT